MSCIRPSNHSHHPHPASHPSVSFFFRHHFWVHSVISSCLSFLFSTPTLLLLILSSFFPFFILTVLSSFPWCLLLQKFSLNSLITHCIIFLHAFGVQPNVTRNETKKWEDETRERKEQKDFAGAKGGELKYCRQQHQHHPHLPSKREGERKRYMKNLKRGGEDG